MKKYILLLFILLTGCTAIENVSEVDIDRKFSHYEIQKIVVLAFEKSSKDEEKSESDSSGPAISPYAKNAVSDIVARELTKWGRYVVMNRRAFKEGLKLKNLKEKDVLHKGNYLDLGNTLGIDAVVAGEIEKFGVFNRTLIGTLVEPMTAEISFMVRCIDVTTNETIWSFKVDGSSKDDDERALASKLVEKAVKTLKAEIR